VGVGRRGREGGTDDWRGVGGGGAVSMMGVLLVGGLPCLVDGLVGEVSVGGGVFCWGAGGCAGGWVEVREVLVRGW